MARGNSLCALSGVQFMASGRDQSRPYISNGGQLLAFTDVAHTSRPPWQGKSRRPLVALGPLGPAGSPVPTTAACDCVALARRAQRTFPVGR